MNVVADQDPPNPNIRLFRMSRRHTLGPIPFTTEELVMVENGDFMTGPSWQVCQPESAAEFSAVGYHFGKQLADSLGIAIGLIQNAALFLSRASSKSRR